jgi:hypothetical protein
MKIFIGALILALPFTFNAQVNSSKTKFGRSFGKDGNNAASIGLNSEFTYKMMEQNQNLRKTTILLEERKRNELRNRSLIIGG